MDVPAVSARADLRGRRRHALRAVPDQSLRRVRTVGGRSREVAAVRRRAGLEARRVHARTDQGAAEGGAERPPHLHRGMGRHRHVRRRARMADLLAFVGADTSARFVEIGCLDDYYSSLDMASCLHPQTLACYEMYGRLLTGSHGAPLRLHLPIKLGY